MTFHSFFNNPKALESEELPPSLDVGNTAAAPSSPVPYVEAFSLDKFPPVFKSLYGQGEKIKKDPCAMLSTMDVGSKVVSSVYKYCADQVSKSSSLKEAPENVREIISLGLTYGALRGMGYNEGESTQQVAPQAAPVEENKYKSLPAYTKVRSFVNAALESTNSDNEDADVILSKFAKDIETNLGDEDIQDIKDLAKEIAVEHRLSKEGYLSLLEFAKAILQANKQ